MQLNPTPDSSPFDYYIRSYGANFANYFRKTYLKTASLIANSCRGSAVLGGHSTAICDIATDYGSNLGIAFQVQVESVN